MRPIAGRMRPKTRESGVFSTKRNRPVSTSMLTRMLVPKPKKAFQSPGAHKIGRKSVVDVVVVIAPSSSWRACPDLSDHGRQIVNRRLPCGNPLQPETDASISCPQRFVANRDEASALAAGGLETRCVLRRQVHQRTKTALGGGYAKIPSDCGIILASVMPTMTTSRWALEGDHESDENTADSN